MRREAAIGTAVEFAMQGWTVAVIAREPARLSDARRDIEAAGGAVSGRTGTYRVAGTCPANIAFGIIPCTPTVPSTTCVTW